MSKRYCCECGHYVPNGVEWNCLANDKVKTRSVCAIKEACDMFIDKTEEEKIAFAPIRMRRKKRRKI